jgi:four helix bundle protein
MTEGAGRKKYNLGERTARFGEAIIRLGKKVPDVTANRPVIRQLIAAGTSVGANYKEADDGSSDRDFCYKIGICRKEASETEYWLRMAAAAEPACKQEARELWREAKQLHLIFARIFRDMKRRIEEEAQRPKV